MTREGTVSEVTGRESADCGLCDDDREARGSISGSESVQICFGDVKEKRKDA